MLRTEKEKDRYSATVLSIFPSVDPVKFISVLDRVNTHGKQNQRKSQRSKTAESVYSIKM